MSSLTIIQNGQAVTTSRMVAENFGKFGREYRIRELDLNAYIESNLIQKA